MIYRTALLSLSITVAMFAGCSDSETPQPGAGPAGDPELDVNPAADAHAGHEHGEEDVIHEVMEAINAGGNSPTKQIGRALEADPVDWETIRGFFPDYVEHASKLADAEPPKGPLESWEKLSAAFAESARGLHVAVQMQNATGAKAAHTALTNSCKPCHNVHRP